MSDLKADGKVIKSEFFHSNELGWYAMLQIQLRGEDFFIAQQLPQKVTCGWERWIPVAERLPEIGDRCLCNVKSFAFPGSFYQAILKYDKYGFVEDCIYTDDVTHWMPLPEPPKEEKNNG